MISLLRKKRRTTRPSIPQTINLELGCLALCGVALLLCSGDGLAAAKPTTLQWGRPQVARRAIVRTAQPLRRSGLLRDTRVVVATWQEEEASPRQQAGTPTHPVAAKPAPPYDPFEEDDRLAQLPNDPFDEPLGESIPVPEPEDNIESVEEAVQEEIERRRSADDLVDEEMEELLESEPLDENPLDDLDDLDLFDDEMDGEDKLQLDKDDWKTPDLDLEDDQDEDEPTPEELEEQRKELAKERRESEESCREELIEIESDRISSIDLSIRVDGNAGEDYPYECAVGTKLHQPRQWPQITYNWKAAALCHKPLYFEQVQLERYGHSWGPYVQPLLSGVHFFGTIPVLPYKMGIRTPNECVYTLGYYRPGSCAPYMIDPIPFTWRAAFFQGAAVTGLSFVIP